MKNTTLLGCFTLALWLCAAATPAEHPDPRRLPPVLPGESMDGPDSILLPADVSFAAAAEASHDALAPESEGAIPADRPTRPGPDGPAAVVRDLRVDDGTPALVFPGWCDIGICGGSNRFDPMDLWDSEGTPPSPLTIQKIHFMVQGIDPAGPMDWYIWEDNGGHKPDDDRILAGPIQVTGQPGQNTIDLTALGQEVRIDPPRMFHVGIRDAQGGVTPRILLDDGLPYVGGTGDFHGAYYYNDTQFCPGWKWGLLSVGGPGGPGDTRSPAWSIWVEVDMDPPPATLTFQDITDQVGSGSRLAWGDADGDGWEDLLVGGQRLYINDANPPDNTFTEVTGSSGIPQGGGANGGIFGDYDNDGDLDIYQINGRCEPCQNSSFGMDRLLRNNGDGTFTDVLAVEYGDDRDAPVPHDVLPTEGAAWGDFNNDGWLDLYAANHVDWDTGECWPDFLWINQGPPDFTFLDAGSRAGLDNEAVLCGRGVAPSDFDGDGDVDIFVTNYRLNRDFLWENTGIDALDVPLLTNRAAGTPLEGTDQLGADAYGHGIGASWGDMDRDGDLDLVVGNLAHSGWRCFSDTTALFESSGGADPTFTDIATPAGIQYNEVHSDASLVDWDNDGWLDLFISHVYDGWRAQLYRNLGTVPTTFEQVTHDSGLTMRSGWGTAWADYDQDGDLDLATRRFYRSNVAADSTNHWLQVELVGTVSNRDALGATVTVSHAGTSQMRNVVGARGTTSQDSRIQHFGLGSDTLADEVRIVFPSGCEVVLTSVAADQRLLIEEPVCLTARFGTQAQTSVSGRVGCAATEVVFEDRSTGPVTDWRWDFDGDTTFDVTGDPAPTWTWADPGVYMVTLEVTDGTATRRFTAPVEVFPPPADPGIALRGDPSLGARVGFDWSTTAVGLPPGGDWALLRADDPQGAWSVISDTGLQDTAWADAAAPDQRLTYYRISARGPGGCVSPDPYRP